jgi:hypothetical protein
MICWRLDRGLRTILPACLQVELMWVSQEDFVFIGHA